MTVLEEVSKERILHDEWAPVFARLPRDSQGVRHFLQRWQLNSSTTIADLRMPERPRLDWWWNAPPCRFPSPLRVGVSALRRAATSRAAAIAPSVRNGAASKRRNAATGSSRSTPDIHHSGQTHDSWSSR